MGDVVALRPRQPAPVSAGGDFASFALPCPLMFDARNWHGARRHANFLKAIREAAFFHVGIVAEQFGEGSAEHDAAKVRKELVDKAHHIAVGKLVQMPAPNRAAVTWKRKQRKYSGGSHAWERAIAADEIRLGLPLSIGEAAANA